MQIDFLASLPTQILNAIIMIETGELNSDKFRLSCSLYEMVELWSMRGHKVELKYDDEQNKEQVVTGVITNIYSREGLEQLVLDEDLILPTKKIISINDVVFRDYLK